MSILIFELGWAILLLIMALLAQRITRVHSIAFCVKWSVMRSCQTISKFWQCPLIIEAISLRSCILDNDLMASTKKLKVIKSA